MWLLLVGDFRVWWLIGETMDYLFIFESSKFQIYSIKAFPLTFAKIFWKKKIQSLIEFFF